MLRPFFLQLFTRRILTYPYSLFFSLLCGSLLTLWLTTYVVNRGQHFQYRHMTNSFGQIMATMAAQQAMDATLNHDRLSLQILLEDITQHRTIVNAAIYDVEHKLIVQAGTTGNQPQSYVRHFSASIALHDTISGHVVLAIDSAHPSGIRYTVLLVLVTSVLASLAVLCLYRGMIRVTTTDSKIKQPNADHLGSNDKNNTNGTILLTLDIKNVNTLYQKLNSDSRKKAINQLHQHIQKALSLYNGTVIYIGSSSVVLSFKVLSFKKHGFQQHHAVFNAICCGYIVSQLNRKLSDFPLSLTIYIHSTPDKTIERKKLLLLRYNTTTNTIDLAIETILLKNSDVESRLLINSEKPHGGFTGICGFQTTYANLLDNQLKYLYGIDE
jgi:uncharacterized membrane protein affecting hemolysin expression